MNPMDFGLRDWLLILGPFFILAVLLHGYWRMRKNRGTLKVALDKSFVSSMDQRKEDADDIALLKAELPSGGARVHQTNPNLGVPQTADEDARDIRDKKYRDRKQQHTSDLSDQDSDHVPVLMEAVDLGHSGRVGARQNSAAAKIESEREEKILLLNLISSSTINGQALLEALVSQNLMFGEMRIFHFKDDQGQIKFSLANAVEPGIFDLQTIKTLETPGVVLFMKAHEVEDPDAVFDEMLEVSRALAEELNCEMKDETQSVLTAQTIEHYRQTIRDYRHKFQGNA